MNVFVCVCRNKCHNVGHGGIVRRYVSLQYRTCVSPMSGQASEHMSVCFLLFVSVHIKAYRSVSFSIHVLFVSVNDKMNVRACAETQLC